MEDRYLRRFVIDELDFDPRVTAAHVGVTVDGGVVTLAGHVGTYAEKQAAERITFNVRGVRAVVNAIEVRPPEDARIGDEELADCCVEAIASDGAIQSDSVQVKVEKGCVTLSGWVRRYDQKAAADRALRQIIGVTDIVNVIGVRPSVTGLASGERHPAAAPT